MELLTKLSAAEEEFLVKIESSPVTISKQIFSIVNLQIEMVKHRKNLAIIFVAAIELWQK